MDISLTEEQETIAEAALGLARSLLEPARIRALEQTEHGLDRDAWREIAQAGWAGTALSADHGGAGLSLLELSLVVTAFGQAALPSPMFSTVIEAGLLLQDAGSDAQRKAWLPRVADGSAVLTVAHAETGDAGLGAMTARIVAASGGYRVSGTKMFVRDAGVAEAIVCAGASERNPSEVSLVVVPAQARGIERRRLQAAGGEALWEVAFNDVAVGTDALIGDYGKAAPHVERLRLRGAAMKAAELVGIGQAALDLTLEYARQRVQFGRPIGSLQAVHHHCTEMYRDLQVCRLLAWQAAVQLGSGRPATREVAMAKAKASEAIPALTRTAHQIHGAVGYYRDYPLELYYNRAVAAQAAYGEAGYHRRALARLMREDIDSFRGEGAHALPVHQDRAG